MCRNYEGKPDMPQSRGIPAIMMRLACTNVSMHAVSVHTRNKRIDFTLVPFRNKDTMETITTIPSKIFHLDEAKRRKDRRGIRKKRAGQTDEEAGNRMREGQKGER